jgi:hypothetical protein
MTEAENERLRRFFGGYFHQDWSFDAPDSDGVIDRYVNDFPEKGHLRTLAHDLEALSSAFATDVDLEVALRVQLGCDGFVPSLVSLSARTWVRELANRLRAASAS